MPDPRSGESEASFLDRCIPVVLDEGVTDPDGNHRSVDSREEASAICYSMFESGKKGDPSPLTPDEKAGWVTVDDQPIFIGGPGQGSGGGSGSYSYAQNREEWVRKAAANEPAPEEVYRWVNLKELHDLTRPEHVRKRHYSMDITEDPDFYFAPPKERQSDSFVHATYGRVILDGPALQEAGWQRDPHLFAEMAWRPTGAYTPESERAKLDAFRDAIKRVEIIHNPTGEPLDYLQGWLDFRMDHHVPVVPHEDYSEWNKGGLPSFHTEQNIPLGAEITLTMKKVKGDDGWSTEVELVSAPTLKTCAAQDCTNDPTWDLTISNRHLLYCDDHLEGAVKLLERHDLVLENIKRLKGTPSPESIKAQTGVILALKPDQETANLLELTDNVDRILADQMHVTLCYLGEIDALSQNHKQERLMRAVEGLADRIAPFEAKLNGVTRFTETHNGRHAMVLNVDSPVLPDLRQKLVETLHNLGYDLNDTHGFTPHLTLAYINEDEDLPDISTPSDPITFSDLYVFWGDNHQRFPLNEEIYDENEHGLKGDWITVDEQPVFVGGPGQGSGSGSGSSTGAADFSDLDIDYESRLMNDNARMIREEAPKLFDTDLERSEHKALEDYQRKKFREVNKRLREGDEPTKTIRNIDSALDKSETKTDIFVYRGRPSGFSGEDIFDPAYMSTSLSREVAASFASGEWGGRSYEDTIRIRVPAGSSAFPMFTLGGQSAKQFEVLLPRGSTLKHVKGDEYELVEASNKAGWITVDDQPVFIGGPGQGSGGGTASKVETERGPVYIASQGQRLPDDLIEEGDSVILIPDQGRGDIIACHRTTYPMHAMLGKAVGLDSEDQEHSIRIRHNKSPVGDSLVVNSYYAVPFKSGRTDMETDRQAERLFRTAARKLIKAGFPKDQRVQWQTAIGQSLWLDLEDMKALDTKATTDDEHFDKIAKELADAEGVKVSAEEIKEVILLPWQRSTTATPASLHLQALSARTFSHSVTYHLKEKIEAVDIQWDFLYPMGAIYNHTQDYLKQEDYAETDTIELYHPFLPTSGPAKQWSEGDQVRIATNPLTSWTTDIQEAAAFARFLASPGSPTFVLKSYLPVKSIISVPAEGFGMPDTGEVIPAGGEYMALVEIRFE